MRKTRTYRREIWVVEFSGEVNYEFIEELLDAELGTDAHFEFIDTREVTNADSDSRTVRGRSYRPDPSS